MVGKGLEELYLSIAYLGITLGHDSV